MMKQILAKRILFMSMFALLASSVSHAGVADWVQEKRQKAQAGVQKKFDTARATTQQLLTSLQANANCLVAGTCPPEEQKKLRKLAAKIGVAVGTLIVAATLLIGSGVYASQKDWARPAQVPEQLTPEQLIDAARNEFMKKVQADILDDRLLSAAANYGTDQETFNDLVRSPATQAKLYSKEAIQAAQWIIAKISGMQSTAFNQLAQLLIANQKR